MYSYLIRESLEKEFHRLAKKNPERLRIVNKKIKEIISCEDINHYKNLRRPLQHLKRVHIDKSFVLVFSVDNNEKQIIIEDIDHHDNIYKN